MCTASTAQRHCIRLYEELSTKNRKKNKENCIFRACVRSPIIPSRRQYVDKMESAPASGLKSPRKTQNVQTVSIWNSIAFSTAKNPFRLSIIISRYKRENILNKGIIIYPLILYKGIGELDIFFSPSHKL